MSAGSVLEFVVLRARISERQFCIDFFGTYFCGSHIRYMLQDGFSGSSLQIRYHEVVPSKTRSLLFRVDRLTEAFFSSLGRELAIRSNGVAWRLLWYTLQIHGVACSQMESSRFVLLIR